MPDHIFQDAEAAEDGVPVWDTGRLAGLIASVGETGVRDLLRLFEAETACLVAELRTAISAGNAAACDLALASIEDAASSLGLDALTARAAALRDRPPEPAFPDLLLRELARVRFVPTLKRAS